MTSYQDLAHNLRQRFGSENQCEVYKLELRSRRRGPHESLSDLMQDIRRLMVLAYSATTSEMWESVAINSLEALGDADLALEVRKRGPTTLEGAYKDALLLEGFLKASVRNEPSKGKGHVRATTDKSAELRRELEDMRAFMKQQEASEKQQIEKQGKMLEQLLQKTSSMPVQAGDNHIGNASQGRGPKLDQPRRSKQVVCYACSQAGHVRRNCPNINQQAMPYDPANGVVCQYCGEYGHTWNECQRRQTGPPGSDQTVTGAGRPPVNRHLPGYRSAFLPATIYQ